MPLKVDRRPCRCSPEKKRAAVAKWNANNRERMLAGQRAYARAHRPEMGAYRKQYVKTHPEIQQVHDARRRAAPGRFTAKEWREKKELFASLCAYCGEPGKLTADHKIPIARGGSNDIANIIPACMSCNLRKGTKTATEFLAA